MRPSSCPGPASRALPQQSSYRREDERDLELAGFVLFADPPKPTAPRALADLAALGVSVKIITGDNKLVAQHVASLVGMRSDRVITGHELDELHDEALWHAAERTDLFVEVDPNQKERITSSAFWGTASTTSRRCIRPTPACR